MGTAVVLVAGFGVVQEHVGIAARLAEPPVLLHRRGLRGDKDPVSELGIGRSIFCCGITPVGARNSAVGQAARS
jgi:hypothetical protein